MDMSKKTESIQKIHEELLFPLFMNAANKLMAALTLCKTEIFYDCAFALTIIAEEELAKTILVPIALETNSADDLFSKRDGAYFHHKKKQKLAAVISLLEKDSAKTEDRKQQALYMANNGNGMHGMNVKKKECVEEIVHAIVLFYSQLLFLEAENKNSGCSKISNKLVRAVLSLTHLIEACMKENAPYVRASINKTMLKLKNKPINKRVTDDNSMKFACDSPYERIKLFKTLFEENYGKKLQETISMSAEEVKRFLLQEVDWEAIRNRFNNGEFS